MKEKTPVEGIEVWVLRRRVEQENYRNSIKENDHYDLFKKRIEQSNISMNFIENYTNINF